MKTGASVTLRSSQLFWRLFTVILLAVLLILPYSESASASAVPSITIVSVAMDTSVSVRLDNFPANVYFNVTMGAYGTSGVQFTRFSSGEGGTFTATWNIPASLNGFKTLFIRVDGETGGYYAYNYFTNNPSGVVVTPPGSGLIPIPTFSIESVVKDSQVTIKTYNFPAHVDFVVRMGAYGTLGVGGVVITTIHSGAGGSFTSTFNIPAGLSGSYRIAIRLDGTSGGYYSYNWFVNNAAAAPTPVAPGYVGIPTFSIQSVVIDSTVTILTNNFPAGLDFTVRMGSYGTYAIGGTVVGTFNSGTGGSFSKNFNIPDGLKGSARIAIRADSSVGGFYAYNWFYNNTAPVPTSTPGGPTPTPVPTVAPGYTGHPTFTILAVQKDQSVTIRAYNLPPGQTFTVRMGAYGTYASGGTVVTTFDSAAGGTQDFTFAVPNAVKGSQRIAIRMDRNLGFYAYNWFWNNSTY
jgi:hypothetical protein